MLAFILLTTCVGVAEGAASVQIGGVTFNGEERTSPFASNVYYGIKYADSSRWNDPTAIDPTTFTSPYDASVNNKPMCYQSCQTFPEFSCVAEMDEDCLYLNIYTPSSATPSSNLPVIFFIHGGNFIEGSGAAILYESDKLVREGVIVVTFNYRLGIFGFLYGNFGLRDQREALKWVSSHISNFGGDPSKITAMGQSAGALSVDLLLTTPDTSSLIYRVILISAPFTLSYRTSTEGYHMLTTFESKAGCNVGDAVCDALDAATVLTYQNDADVTNYNSDPLSAFMKWGPVIDEILVPTHPFNLHKYGLIDVKDTLLGTTRDEGVGYVATGPGATDYLFLLVTVGAIEPAILPLIPLYPLVPDTRFTLADMATDYVFRCVAREVAQLIDQERIVYRYEFNHLFPAPILNDVCDTKACHGNDLTYIFGSFNYISEYPSIPAIPFQAEDVALSTVIVKSFTRFSKGLSTTTNPYKWRRNGPWNTRWSYILTANKQFSSVWYFNESLKCNAMTSFLASQYNPEYTPPTV